MRPLGIVLTYARSAIETAINYFCLLSLFRSLVMARVFYVVYVVEDESRTGDAVDERNQTYN